MAMASIFARCLIARRILNREWPGGRILYSDAGWRESVGCGRPSDR